MPSLRGMLVYSDFTSKVTNKEMDGIAPSYCLSICKNCVVSFMYVGISCTICLK